jgi:hypothetical protein
LQAAQATLIGANPGLLNAINILKVLKNKIKLYDSICLYTAYYFETFCST